MPTAMPMGKNSRLKEEKDLVTLIAIIEPPNKHFKTLLKNKKYKFNMFILVEKSQRNLFYCTR